MPISCSWLLHPSLKTYHVLKFCCVPCAVLCYVQIEGRENLPPPATPAVYVANHQSFMVSAKGAFPNLLNNTSIKPPSVA